MQIFHRRPLALAATLFAVSAVIFSRLGSLPKQILLALLALTLGALILVRCLRRRASVRLFVTILCVAAILLAVLSSCLFFDLRYADLQKTIGEEHTVEGYVLERIGSGPFYSYLRVRVTAFDGGGAPFDAIFETDFPSSLQIGECFLATVVPRDYTAEEGFDERIFRLSDGCLLVLTLPDAAEYQRVDRDCFDLEVLATKLNHKLAYALRNRVGGESGGLCAAFLLGNRTWLTDDTALHFRRAGISHLLALSGLHVSILIAFVDFLLQRLRTPRPCRAVLIPLLALCYLLLTGCAPSTCRAVLMTCTLYLAFSARSRYDSLTALCTVLAAILLLTPYAIWDLSLWMSFLAAASIIIFSPALAEWTRTSKFLSRLPLFLAKAIGSLVSALFVGLVANLSLLLLSAAVFGELSLASIPTTLLLSIPVTLLIICSAIVLLLPILPLLPSACATLAELHLTLAQTFSDLEWVMLPANDTPTRAILMLLTLILILLAICRVRHPLRILSTVFPILLLITVVTSTAVTYRSPHYGEKTQIFSTYFGEIELRTEHGEAILINRVRNNISEANGIKQAALRERATDIDHLIYPRYYNQSTYFLLRLCATMRVETLHLPPPRTDRERAIADRICEEAEVHGVRVVYDADRWPG